MEQIALEGVNGSIAASMEIDRGVDAFYLSTHMKASGYCYRRTGRTDHKGRAIFAHARV